MSRDIICGMYVDETRSPITAVRRGMTYYFCSTNCLDTFLAPERELRRLKSLAAFSLTLGSITLFFEYFYPPLIASASWNPPLLGLPMYYWLFVLATLVQFIGGWKFYKGTLDAIRARQANMDSLIATGTSAAWVYSTIVTFAPQLLPAISQAGPHVYFTESGLIIGFILLGNVMEHLVKGRASEAIYKLLDLRPKTARVLKGAEEVEVPVEQVQKDDVFVVRPGERLAVDGLVIEGYSGVDQSVITGESIPVEKRPGDEVIGASINKTGLLKVRATRVGADTTLSQIVKMVEEAIVSRSPIQRLADTVSAYFVPAVVAIAIASTLYWYLVVGLEFSTAFIVLVAVLIVACPCALGIATPAALMIGASNGARSGILIKGGEFLEKSNKLTTVVFDKTGTLTKGEPSVTDVVVLSPSVDASEMLHFAASVEKGSEHPLGEAIIGEARGRGLKLYNPEAFEAVPGLGVRARVAKRAVGVGNRRFLESQDVRVLPDVESRVSALETDGKTVMFVLVDGELAGLIAVADTLKASAVEGVRMLADLSVEVLMLTGDNKRTADAIARKAGIAGVIADVMPGDKARVVERLKREGKVVAMVGDGINDAPALAAADVGIAIGSGTDVAKEAGGIVLIKDDVRDVARAIHLARRTVRKIKQNLFWAFIYNILLIPVAAGVLFAFGGPMMNPIFAAVAMAFSSVTVTLNSMLLNRWKPTAGALRVPAPAPAA